MGTGAVGKAAWVGLQGQSGLERGAEGTEEAGAGMEFWEIVH